MTKTSPTTSVRRATIAWLAPLVSLFVPTHPAAAGTGTTACSTGSPALPVPDTRTVNNQVFTLWPDSGFRPARNPGEALPQERDSTEFVGLPWQLPGAGSGLELFTDLDIAGNYAYVAYNAGFSIWNLSGAFAASPDRRGVRDGFEPGGGFCSFEPVGEADLIIWDIAYVNDGGDEMVALAGAGFETGLTLWDVNDKDAPVELYQDTVRIGRRVEAVRFRNEAFAFFGTTEAVTSGGLHVYNMSQAASCTATPFNGCGSNCPGVYLGEIGDWRDVQFLALLKRTINNSEKLFVAVSDGPKTLSLGVEIHEVTDVRGPGLLSSRHVFSGLDSRSRGISLFEHENKAYLAVKENTTLKIFDVTTCLDSNNCSSLQNDTPVWSEAMGLVGTKEELVTFSQADAANPFLYFGNDTICLRGSKKERLLDLRNLGNVNPVLPELTDGGESYPDPGHGQLVDYWGSYYDLNTDGFTRVAPRVAKVRREPSNNTLYFYRVGWTIFDVHQFGGAAPPPGTPTAEVSGPADGWLGDATSFTATAQNCAGAENWSWWFSEGGSQSTLGPSTNILNHTFPLPGVGTAPGQDRFLAVGATKNACDSGQTMEEANVEPQAIQLRDPRPVIPGLAVAPDSGPFPRGTLLTFSSAGSIGGKTPLTYAWSVIDPQGNAVPDLAGTTGSQLTWDTCAATLDMIFSDGFESGNTQSWALVTGPPESVAITSPATKSGSASTYTAKLDVTSQVDLGPLTTSSTLDFEIVPEGTPVFSTPPIAVEGLLQGQYRLTAATNGLETEWRWEIEDGNGPETCTFGPLQKSCFLFDWGEQGSEVTHTWTTPNLPGTFLVRLEVRSRGCDESGFVGAGPESIGVDVTDIATPVAPEITSFTVEEGGPASCECSQFAPCHCLPGQPITFTVTAEGSFNTLEFTWGDGSSVQSVPRSDETNVYTLTHTYSTSELNYYIPMVKAVGVLESEFAKLPHDFLEIW